MAVDTRDKRASASWVNCPWRLMSPAPDATVDQGDRQQVARAYRGILASGSIVTLVTFPDPYAATSTDTSVDPYNATSQLRHA